MSLIKNRSVRKPDILKQITLWENILEMSRLYEKYNYHVTRIDLARIRVQLGVDIKIYQFFQLSEEYGLTPLRDETDSYTYWEISEINEKYNK